MGPDEDKWCTQIKDNGQTPDGFHYGYKAQAEFMAKFLDDEMNGKNKKKSGKKVEKSINSKKESDGESKKKKVIKSVNRDNRFGKKTKDADSSKDASSSSNDDDDVLE